MITRFRVQNYKALRDVTLDLTPVHVLIGPNDSGKTSLLTAMAALCRSVNLELSNAFLGSWDGRDLVTHNLGDKIQLSASFKGTEDQEIEYQLGCRFPVSGRGVTSIGESVSCKDAKEIVEFREAGGRSAVQTTSTDQILSPHLVNSGEVIFAQSMTSEIHSALGRVAFHRWEPRFLSLPVAPDAKRSFQMDHNGFGLALCLDDILGFDRKRFGQLEERFISIFPLVKAIRLVQESAYRSSADSPSQVTLLSRADGKGIQIEFVNSSKLVPASQLSDGLLIVLAYLTLLYLPQPPRVLLIEEPENGIHPARLKEIIRILKQLVSEQTHTQIVMTTHSPYVVHEFEPNEVTICVRGADGAVQTRRLSESQTVRDQIDFFSLGEIWTQDGDEALLRPLAEEAIAIEEGPTTP